MCLKLSPTLLERRIPSSDWAEEAAEIYRAYGKRIGGILRSSPTSKIAKTGIGINAISCSRRSVLICLMETLMHRLN